MMVELSVDVGVAKTVGCIESRSLWSVLPYNGQFSLEETTKATSQQDSEYCYPQLCHITTDNFETEDGKAL